MPATKKQLLSAATKLIIGDNESVLQLLCPSTFTIENLTESQRIFAPSLTSPPIAAVFFGREPTSALKIAAVELASAWSFVERSLT